MAAHSPAGWYPDPTGQYERRYWDGGRWTEHVSSGGHQSNEQPVGSSSVVGRSAVAGEPILSEAVLIFNRKGKRSEGHADYSICNGNGQPIGAVRGRDQSMLKQALGSLTFHGEAHDLQIQGTEGRVHLRLTRPTKLLRSKMVVAEADGTRIGEIRQQSFGLAGVHISFDLEAGGDVVGSIVTKDRQSRDCVIRDADGHEVARVEGARSGLAKRKHSKVDNHVLRIHRPLKGPIRALVVAAPLAVDLALRQYLHDMRRPRFD